MNKIDLVDREIDILENIAKGNRLRQRDLSRLIGFSLGMTNVIVKRLVQKGWLKVKKVNNRNIQYIVSPAGMEQIARRSYRYVKRTVKNVALYKEATKRFVGRVAAGGYGGIVLVGPSDLDFLVEHFCAKNRLAFRAALSAEEASDRADNFFVLFSESYTNVSPEIEECAYLSKILIDA
jgi:DNA-binding MarR family transcriptional regulator